MSATAHDSSVDESPSFGENLPETMKRAVRESRADATDNDLFDEIMTENALMSKYSRIQTNVASDEVYLNQKQIAERLRRQLEDSITRKIKLAETLIKDWEALANRN